MSFSKIAQIALYIVVGISVLVIGFFYFGDSFIDMDAYNAKIEKMNAPVNMSANYMNDMNPITDTSNLVADSSLTETDSTDLLATEVVAGENGNTEMEAAGAEEVSEPEEVEEVHLSFMEKIVDKKTDIAIIWAYILVIVTLIVAVVFSIAQMFSNTKALIRGLIVLVGVAILIGIAYMLSSDTPLNIIGYEGTDNSDPHVLKMVDMGLITTYFVLGGLLISILYSEIAKYFK